MPQDGVRHKERKLVRAVRRQQRMLKRARYPLRRSKYANHLYDDRQHVIMLVLRQHFRMPYRQFCETMGVCTVLTGEIGLSSVPHFTTLQKFSARMDIRRLERLHLAFLERTPA